MLPAARDAIAAVDADPRAATKLLVTGGVGTGKTTLLAAVRTGLRSGGRQVLSRPPEAGTAGDDGYALVVDDAHLLDDADLDRLIEVVGQPASTVVIATQPLIHRPRLQVLMTALARENPEIALRPLSPAEVHETASSTLGAPVGPELTRLLLSATGGFPFLLSAALPAVPDGAPTVRQAARIALIERLTRLDGSLLDTLLVTTLSSGLGSDDVAAALRIPADDAVAAVDSARATALIEPSHTSQFLTAVHDGIAQIVGAARHHDIEMSVLDSQLELSTLTADLALRIADHGVRDDRLAGALTDFAARVATQPARAARLYRAATDAGTTAVRPALADALAVTGDCATAGRLADDLLASQDPAERAAAVRIAASIALHDGAAGQAADLFAWLGPASDAVVGAAATIGALAVGDAAAVRSTAQGAPSGPPTSVARSARAITEGLALTLDQPYPAAIARLSQAIAADAVHGVLPDTPAALVTLAALHGGDPVRARSVIGRAVLADRRPDRADATFVTSRHRLLQGWAYMQDGQLAAAAAAIPPDGDPRLHRRDALWTAALHTGIARRNGDTGAMQTHWRSAMDVLAESSADVFTVLPLGELWIAASRLRQADQLQHSLDEAFRLLAGLGDPLLWSLPLHWAGVHAGILANSPDAVAPHGAVLTSAAPHSQFAKALAAAGRTWLRVLADRVDIAEVTAAARGLALHGHTWDATRLAGQTALQTTDSRTSQAMLQLARDLKQTVTASEAPPAASAEGRVGPPSVVPQRASATQLSDREREVAELLLQGLPYREIGSQLFISAKTVEHHVARIRRRLGAESRSEMLSMLRAALDTSASR